MSVLVLHTPPASEPVTAEAVAASLGLFEADARLGGFIQVARQSLEGVQGWLGRALVTQTWDLYLDAFPADELRLPFPPFQRIDEIAVTDGQGVETLLPSARYRALKGEFGIVVPNGGWPNVGAERQGVRVRFTCGYGDTAEEVAAKAAPIVQAITLMAGRLLSASRADMAMRARTVEGVGSTSWMNPDDVRKGITATEDALLAPFRVWS
ncbi:hypothetical protein [Aureimonas sp. SK2]|uniref:head-tail connector protein n=1 Tax=Aureimonas sp. SK2 TaxID=3015992 RepID=UPI0024447352|nr:hypothetical protein [Aureimonas sp. SK2]